MTYPVSDPILDPSSGGSIYDLVDIQHESPIIANAIALYCHRQVTEKAALVLAIKALHQSNKDLYQMCIDLSANKPPPPIVISKEQWEVLNKKNET